jgi:two-component system, response regulator / RNA-binding antiterminator
MEFAYSPAAGRGGRVTSSKKLRVALVDEKAERSSDLERALGEAGFEVVARLGGRDDLRSRIGELEPDVVIIDMQLPDRDVLEDMQRMHREQPRPIVMFVDESDSESIRVAVEAGVSAYVVDGLKARSVRPIIEVAIARFRAFQALRNELAAARISLAERKLIERAKGILMSRRGVNEEEAYQLLRKSAMDRNMKLVDVARQLIEMAEFL